MAEPIPILEIQTGKFKGRKITLSAPEVIVGRGARARIRIPSPEVSREHCRLIFKNRRLQVEDLKSRNGTFINGRPITGKRFLAPGSTLTVGPMTFRLLGSGPPPERPSAEIFVAGKQAAVADYSDDEVANWIATETLTGLEELVTESDFPLVPPEHFLPKSATGESGTIPADAAQDGRRP